MMSIFNVPSKYRYGKFLEGTLSIASLTVSSFYLIVKMDLDTIQHKRHSKPRLYVFSMDSISRMPCVIPTKPRLLTIRSGVKKSLF